MLQKQQHHHGRKGGRKCNADGVDTGCVESAHDLQYVARIRVQAVDPLVELGDGEGVMRGGRADSDLQLGRGA